MRRLRIPEPSAAAAAAAVLSLTLAAPAAASRGTDRADTALARALRAVRARPGGPPGLAAVVQRGARRGMLVVGVADVRSRRRFGLHDRMRIASTAKAFSGALALRLVDAGRLSLDDTIARRLPDLPGSWGPITLRELLQHRSGLANITAAPALTARLRREPRATVRPRQLLGFAESLPLQFRPGARYEYSNTDNLVVGLMVEAATADSYERELGTRVLDPLRLRDTSLPATWLMPGPAIRGYDTEPGRRPEDVTEAFSASLSWASGGIVSTPADLNAFIRGWAGPGLLRPVTRAAQRSFVPGGGEPPGPGANAAGLAIYRYRTRCGTVYGHTGNTLGYTQFMAATADGTRSIVISANGQINPSPGSRSTLFRYLRRAFEAGACAALAR